MSKGSWDKPVKPGHHHCKCNVTIPARTLLAAGYMNAVIPGKKMTDKEIEDVARQAFRVADIFLAVAEEDNSE
jgi:hypothetical protein